MNDGQREVSRKIAEKAVAQEPRDGSHLIVQDWSGYMSVIWRDDRNARGEDRWFAGPDDDPMSLAEHLKDAMAVFRLGDILAGFHGAY